VKKPTRVKICYAISVGYIILSLFFLDWSFNMVPYTGNTPTLQIVVNTIQEIWLFLIGLVIFISTFLISRQNPNVFKIFRVLFWMGGLVFVGLFLLALYLKQWMTLEIVLYSIFIAVLLYVPVIIVFMNLKALNREIVLKGAA